MLPIAIFAGKATVFGLKVLGRSGSALPGLVVEKINPNFLKSTLGKLPKGVVVVSGTNGKTTTTKIIVELLQDQGLKVITNSTGSNFVRGIISSTLRNVSINGKLPYDIAVIELDEAHAVRFTKFLKPNGFVALNIMRDQMDRFGEIDTTAKLLQQVADSTTDFLVLNANDPRIAKIADKNQDKKVFWFGHSKQLITDFARDDEHHSKDKKSFFEASTPQIILTGLKAGQVELQVAKQKFVAKVKLEGTHNAINIIAGLTAVKTILPQSQFKHLLDDLSDIEPAFGRGEIVILNNGHKLRLQLVKNPASFTHSLRLLDELDYHRVAVVINDDFADSRDVSWLWDVEFASMTSKDVLCGGTRAYDMALRLKYDEVETAFIETDLAKFVEKLKGNNNDSTIVFCTYTAMIKMRRLLKSHTNALKEVGV